VCAGRLLIPNLLNEAIPLAALALLIASGLPSISHSALNSPAAVAATQCLPLLLTNITATSMIGYKFW